jgi:LmbE family N-acetylglucosaminyl deacetylase
MTATPAPPVLIVLLAHPDDEFAVFPWIREAVRVGRTVRCVWVTDGGWGGQDVSHRRAESVKVLSRLGVDPAAMDFLGERCGIADGKLYLMLDKAIESLSRSLGATIFGAEVLLPAWEGGHHDHDACHLAGLAVVHDANARVRQYTLYQGKGLPGAIFKVMAPLPSNGPTEPIPTSISERMRYAALCFSYTSQWKSFLGLLPFYFLRMLKHDAFVTQPVDPRRTMGRPHLGRLLYERRGGPSWEEFAVATRKYRGL